MTEKDYRANLDTKQRVINRLEADIRYLQSEDRYKSLESQLEKFMEGCAEANVEVLKAKNLIRRFLKMFQEASEGDDACVGYKHRERLLNECRLFIGEPPEAIPENWRE